MSTAEHTGQSDLDALHLTFEQNSLYILLSNRGDKSYTFHWCLYLHQNTTSGSIYHLLNGNDPTIWRFEHLPDPTVIYDQALLGALKIGVFRSVRRYAPRAFSRTSSSNTNRRFSAIPRENHLPGVAQGRSLRAR